MKVPTLELKNTQTHTPLSTKVVCREDEFENDAKTNVMMFMCGLEVEKERRDREREKKTCAPSETFLLAEG